MRNPPRRTPTDRLLSAIHTLAGPHAAVLATRTSPWASITFSGTRHTVTLAFDGEAAVAAGEAFITALPDHEFAIPHHLVAEATIATVEHRLLPRPRLEIAAILLLLEDA